MSLHTNDGYEKDSKRDSHVSNFWNFLGQFEGN